MKKKYAGKYDLKELEERKEQNARERAEFIDWYADWVRKTPNRIWSKVHKKFMES